MERRLSNRQRTRQSGYALILMVVALMGIGGAVIAGFTQGAKQDTEHQRYLHNQRVLREAKQALLMFAYNYPVTNNLGPGRLPNADTDNDGIANDGFTFGRLPWAQPNLNLYDIRDADGQRLWYAVSSSFRPQASQINSGTSGTITLRDQSGNIIFDGSNAGGLTRYGVAAVIIAPDAVIDRDGVAQDRSVENGDDPFDYTDSDDTDKDTDPGIITASNYLDLVVGTEDNSGFTNSDADDGLILGPVNDLTNDQLIVITAEEVTAMAEKAVLEHYRAAIEAYQVTIWGAVEADYRYPWTNAYASIADLNIYDVTPGTVIGRVPYLNFYTDLDSHTVITDLAIVYDVQFDLSDTADLNVPTYLAAFNTVLAGGVTVDLANTNLSFSQVSRPGLVDNTTDNFGAIVGTGVGTDDDVITRFFWDAPAEDGWEVCAPPATSPLDCARDPTGTVFVPWTDWDDHADIKIRRVQLRFEVDSVFEVGLDFDPAPAWNAPTAPTAAPPPGTNARREAVIDPLLVTDMPVDFDGTLPNDFIEITVADCEQDNFVDSAYIPGPCLPVPTLNNIAVTVHQLDITTDYYPELPEWVRSNRWNDSILLAYADGYKPGGTQTCTTGTDCLTVTEDFDGSMDDKISLLLGSGMLPLTVADLATMFEGENVDPLDAEFSAHPLGGNDAMLIMEQN